MSTPNVGESAKKLDLADLTARIHLTPRARPLLNVVATPDELLASLLRENLHVDAIPVLAHLLQIRRAVWWGILATWHASGGEPSAQQDAALQAAVHWVIEPSAEHAGRAREAADRATVNTAAGCCAKAASVAGVQATADTPFEPRQPQLAARLAGSAIIMAFARASQREPKITYRHFVELGREIEAGEHLWEPSPT